MTVLEVIQRSTEFLNDKGIESPRLQIELMLAHVLRLKRLELYLNYTRSLTETNVAELREMVKRRAQREPLQHILGTVSFHGLELAVNRDVLIPRTETELLAERAAKHLVATFESRLVDVLDFGTGSGCLAIALAAACPAARIHAVDVSPAALAVAKTNAERHRLADRIIFHAGDGFAALPAGLDFDLLISNPPYVPSADIATLEPEVRDHDPRLALDGGPDGLDFYRRLASEAPTFLKPGGWAFLEFGDGQASALEQLFSLPPWEFVEIGLDDSPRPRFLIARRVL